MNEYVLRTMKFIKSSIANIMDVAFIFLKLTSLFAGMHKMWDESVHDVDCVSSFRGKSNKCIYKVCRYYCLHGLNQADIVR